MVGFASSSSSSAKSACICRGISGRARSQSPAPSRRWMSWCQSSTSMVRSKGARATSRLNHVDPERDPCESGRGEVARERRTSRSVSAVGQACRCRSSAYRASGSARSRARPAQVRVQGRSPPRVASDNGRTKHVVPRLSPGPGQPQCRLRHPGLGCARLSTSPQTLNSMPSTQALSRSAASRRGISSSKALWAANADHRQGRPQPPLRRSRPSARTSTRSSPREFQYMAGRRRADRRSNCPHGAGRARAGRFERQRTADVGAWIHRERHLLIVDQDTGRALDTRRAHPSLPRLERPPPIITTTGGTPSIARQQPFGARNSLAPCDDDGHGTHTAARLGDDGGSNQIGVAPEAKWIACRSNGSRESEHSRPHSRNASSS